MNEVLSYLKTHKEYYKEYFLNDRLSKCKYGYTCDINQIYCYLNKIDIKCTEYYTFYNISLQYFDFNNKNIVDVCCGKIPILSSLYKNNNYKIEAIDKQIVANNYNGIKTIEYDLRKKYSFKKYDIILSIRPCEPTDYIINLCLKERKDFMIYLCPCTHKTAKGKKFKKYDEWINYLKYKLSSHKEYNTIFLTDDNLPDNNYIIIAKYIYFDN